MCGGETCCAISSIWTPMLSQMDSGPSYVCIEHVSSMNGTNYQKSVVPAHHHSGQRQVLTDTEIGMALYLLTGLPPFLRVKELRAGNRGELSLSGSGWAVEPLKPEEMVNQKVDYSNSF